MLRTLHTAWIMLLATVTLVACGSEQDISSLRENDVAATELALALGAETSGSYALLLAGPTTVSSMTVCELGTTGLCVKTLNSTLSRTTADRKIFQVTGTVAVAEGSSMKIAATYADSTTKEQKIRFSAVTSSAGATTGKRNWKMVLMASDQGNQGAWISAFDNARQKIKQIFTGMSVPDSNIQELSLHPEFQKGAVKATSIANFKSSVSQLGATGTNDACLVHMTSHGSSNGFNVGYDRLSPQDLDAALTAGCGDRPTVVLVSACFSGLYVLDSSGVKKPNRVILTAARHDRTSFGCGTENQYTYWDNCLIDNLQAASTFKDLASKIEACIVRKEGGQTSSFPQTFIGSQVENLTLPGK